MVCVPEPIDILRCGPAEWSEILRRGARAWNAWRDDYPWIIPDLTGIAPSVIECQLGPLTGGPINLANARLRGALLAAPRCRRPISKAPTCRTWTSPMPVSTGPISLTPICATPISTRRTSPERGSCGPISAARIWRMREISFRVSCLAPSAMRRPCCRTSRASATWPGATREVQASSRNSSQYQFSRCEAGD